MPFKIDFHCHTHASPDGSLNEKNIEEVLSVGKLDYIAITDHNTTSEALKMKKIFGDKIIVGEEISTQAGEIIGLYIKSTIAPGLALEKTVKEIIAQDGLVYIPHPFEKARKGLKLEDLEKIKEQVNIVEVVNGRSFSKRARAQAARWASQNNKPTAASSDAHGRLGWGRVYTEFAQLPTRENVLESLRESSPVGSLNGSISYLYPKLNRLRKALS